MFCCHVALEGNLMMTTACCWASSFCSDYKRLIIKRLMVIFQGIALWALFLDRTIHLGPILPMNQPTITEFKISFVFQVHTLLAPLRNLSILIVVIQDMWDDKTQRWAWKVCKVVCLSTLQQALLLVLLSLNDPPWIMSALMGYLKYVERWTIKHLLKSIVRAIHWGTWM